MDARCHAAPDRRAARLFALLALVLAAVGIYGVLSYLVSSGHTRSASAWRWAQRGPGPPAGARPLLTLTASGLAIGLALAAGLTRLMAGVLHGVTPLDPLTFLAVPALLAAVAAVASYIPARRAARIDPMLALRVD